MSTNVKPSYKAGFQMNFYHNLDLIIVFAFIAFIMIIALCSFGNVDSFKSYASFNRNISVTLLTATLFATIFEGMSIFGFSENLMSKGIVFFIAYIILDPLSLFILAKFIVPRVKKFKKILTVGDIIQQSYGKKSKFITGIAGILLSCGYVAVQISVIGYLFQNILGLNKIYGILACSIIMIFYSVRGGLNSVIYTDLFQFCVMIILIPEIFTIEQFSFKLLPNIIQDSIENNVLYSFKEVDFYYWLSIAIIYIVPFIDPAILQRIIISNDVVKTQKALYFTIILLVIYQTIIFLVAIIARWQVNNIDESLFLYEFIKNAVPLGVKGLVVSGIIASLMSTADSYLNTIGVIFVKDIIEPINIKLRDRQKLFIARFSTVIILCFSIYAAVYSDSIFELILFFLNFWGPIVVIPLIAAICGFKFNDKIFMISALLGILTLIYWHIFDLKNITKLEPIIIGFALNIIVLLSSNLTKFFIKEDKKVIF